MCASGRYETPTFSRGRLRGRLRRLALVHRHAVGDDHALGTAGRARRVEHGQRVVRSQGAPAVARGVAEAQEGLPRDVRRAGRAAVQDDDLPQRGQARQHRAPAVELVRAVQYGVARLTVGGDVRDLVGRQRGVEGRRDTTGVHHAEVSQHVLGAVGHHQRDGLAGSEAERGERGGDPQDLPPGLRPGQGLLAVGEGGRVGVPLRRLAQSVGDRPARDLLLDPRPLLQHAHQCLRCQ